MLNKRRSQLQSKKNIQKDRKIITKPVLAIITVPILLVLSYTVSGYSVYAQNAGILTKMTNIIVQGNKYPITYNITNAKVVSIVPQPEAAKLVITIEPTKEGNLTIDLSRQLIDYKIAGNKDGNYIVHVNGKQIPNFKESSNTAASRTLEISFGSGDRTIEITGTQMAQGQVGAVKAQTEAAVKTQLAANKTKESLASTNKNIGANASQMKGNVSGMAGSVVNKTVGVLSNITGGIKKALGGK